MPATSQSDRFTHLDLAPIRAAQQPWAATPIASRLRILRAFRHDLAESARELALTVPLDIPGHLHRSLADTLCSELLPMAEACRFLERAAQHLLTPVQQSSRLRPLWLGGVRIETRREPLGIVLLIAPGNYPLFLPGAQALQALAAGNAVLWKPTPGGSNAAIAMRTLLIANGLAPHLLTILDDSPAAAQAAIEAGVDKVILTGSAQTGRAVLHSLADHLTPSVMELSGCDAVFVLDGADLDRVIDAIVFGLRFNGSATCMAPRRLIVSEPVAAKLIPRLKNALCNFEPIPATKSARALIGELIEEAVLFGANVQLNGLGDSPRLGPTLIAGGAPSMRIAQADIFAPILTVLAATSEDDALHLHRQCPYALTAAVFGPAHAAQQFATRVHAGTVLVNDVIVSSADPRISFGGRGKSGFGVTRGAEGLLEMTALKNIVVQNNRSRRAFQPTTIAHTDFFVALLRLLHGGRWAAKYAALLDLIRSARTLKP